MAFKINDSLIDFKKHSIASLISYMPQETMLFNLSIKENIVFGKDYDEVKFRTAVKTASVDEIISTVKNGENYIVGKNGNLLSGGQRQRIALARAIYNDSEVILLDEATSNLDLKLDEKIFTNLNKLKKTFIVTSHRISSIINADCIYLFEDGEIVDSGKHDELLAKNKKYQIIYELENLNND